MLMTISDDVTFLILKKDQRKHLAKLNVKNIYMSRVHLKYVSVAKIKFTSSCKKVSIAEHAFTFTLRVSTPIIFYLCVLIVK